MLVDKHHWVTWASLRCAAVRRTPCAPRRWAPRLRQHDGASLGARWLCPRKMSHFLALVVRFIAAMQKVDALALSACWEPTWRWHIADMIYWVAAPSYDAGALVSLMAMGSFCGPCHVTLDLGPPRERGEAPKEPTALVDVVGAHRPIARPQSQRTRIRASGITPANVGMRNEAQTERRARTSRRAHCP
eukprot:6162232-Alexandrium_andersonii.AAC.1